MVLSTEGFIAQFEGLSLMELAVERDRLFYDVEEERREQSRGFLCYPEGMNPSPEVRLWAMEKYLLAMDELVASREAGEGLKVEDLPLPEGFVSACGKAYNLIGPIFMAEEVLGCWVFRTTRELTISGPVGVVISTGELVHFHIPALMRSSGACGKHAKQIESIVGYPRDTILEELCDENSRRPIYRVPNEFRE
ncbi:MAG: hypothetical protein IJ111_06090 [Eggerthellaceae bacterium]|nr:hypothetical protein [Eggerthellaceae bacterium]